MYLRLLGPVEVLDASGSRLPLGGAKQRTVLAVLALDAGTVVSSDRLIDEVWGDRPPTGARATLQVYVSNLRRILRSESGVEWIVTRPPGYLLETDPEALDLGRFDQLVAQGERALADGKAEVAASSFRKATELWRGEPLADIPFNSDYGHRGSALTERRMDAFESLMTAELALGRHRQVIPELEAATARHPLREGLWGSLMLALYRSGRQADALQAFSRAREGIVEQLGLDPGPALRALEAGILRQDSSLAGPAVSQSAAAASSASVTAPTDVVGNLPVAISRFVGRDTEVGELTDLLADQRLVTVLGFGGIGKTRLALKVAGAVAEAFPGGTWFIDLSTTTTAAQIPAIVAASLGLSDGGDDPMANLHRRLADKKTLIILDNLEHLIPDAAPVVDRLVGSLRRLTVLATSRVPLRIAGEQEFALKQLQVPPVPRTGLLSQDELAELSAIGAVSLFLNRAAAVRLGFSLTADNAADVIAICDRLNGMPLALELAAVRLRNHSPAVLLARLDNSLSVLVDGPRNLPERQRTLRATIAWSYRALAAAGQQLLRRLACFPSTFTLEAAQQIVPSDGDGLIDVLGELVDHSLVRYQPANDPDEDDRYDLLVSIREFADEELTASGEAATLRQRHATYYAARARLRTDWTRDDFLRTKSFVAAELDNLRAALALFESGPPNTEAVALAGMMAYVLSDVGLPGEAREITDRILARAPAGPDRVFLLRNRVRVEYNSEQLTPARLWAQRALAEARLIGESSLLGAALSAAATTARSRVDVRALVEEADSLLASLPEHGNYLSAWFVRLTFVGSDLLYWLDPARTEANLRAGLLRKTIIDDDSDRVQLATILLRRGAVQEAAELLRRYEQKDVAETGAPWAWVEGAIQAAALRTYTGELNIAFADLALADRRLRRFNVSGNQALLTYQRAVFERARGDLGAADRLLRSLLDESATSADVLQRAEASWLLAVIQRELGQHNRAAVFLLSAWRMVAGWDAQHLITILLCLIEAAIQLSPRRPVDAARVLAVVERERHQLALLDGGYDVPGLQRELRRRLGDQTYSAAVLAADQLDLPADPEWLNLFTEDSVTPGSPALSSAQPRGDQASGQELF